MYIINSIIYFKIKSEFITIYHSCTMVDDIIEHFNELTISGTKQELGQYYTTNYKYIYIT